MTDKEKLERIKIEMERRLNDGLSMVPKNDYVRGRIHELNNLLAFIDHLQEEPECIYNHSLEERQRFCKYCSAACQVRVKDEPKDKCKGCNNVKGCITCVDGSEWAHYEEPKIHPVFDEGYWERLGEEPVSDIDFEKELYKAFGQVKDFTLGLQIAKWFYDMGKNRQEPVSEDIEKEIDHAHKLFYEEVGWDSDEGARAYVADWFAYYFAKWQKEHLWKPADGADLPDIDREVIALLGNGKVVFAHRPPEYWDGKNIYTGKVTRYYPKTYDKGGWNLPDVKFWLDVELPKEIEI